MMAGSRMEIRAIILQELQVEIEQFSQKLRDSEPYWSKCFPCANNGRCCAGANTYFSMLEWSRANKAIATDTSLKKLIDENITKDRKCIFYRTENSQCIIHEDRPLHCRFTPYFISHRYSGPRCFIKSDDCRKFIEFSPVSIVSIDGESPFVHVKTPDGLTIRYIDIMRHEKFRNFIVENQPRLLSWWIQSKKQ